MALGPSRKRLTMRRFITLTLVLASWYTPQTAIAARVSADGSSSPNWSFGVRFGPYRPQQQRGYGDNGDIFFGKDKRPLMKSVVVHWYLYDGLGLAGLAFGVGFWSIEGRARLCQDNNAPVVCSPDTVTASVAGNSTTSITTLPLSLGLVYRMDLFKRWWAIPLIPYAEAGFDYHFWWNRADGQITSTRRDGKTFKGRGGSPSYHGALGVALSLGWIEPRTSRRARSSSGMTDSYIFGEIREVVGVWEFDVSDTVLSLGLAVEFL